MPSFDVKAGNATHHYSSSPFNPHWEVLGLLLIYVQGGKEWFFRKLKPFRECLLIYKMDTGNHLCFQRILKCKFESKAFWLFETIYCPSSNLNIYRMKDTTCKRLCYKFCYFCYFCNIFNFPAFDASNSRRETTDKQNKFQGFLRFLYACI